MSGTVQDATLPSQHSLSRDDAHHERRRARREGVNSCLALCATALSFAVFVPSFGQVAPPTPVNPAPTPAGVPAPGTAAPATNPAAPTTAPSTKPARPLPRAVPADPNALTDEKIGNAIQKGVDWLLTQFDPKTNAINTAAGARGAKGAEDMAHHGGLDALAVYALLQSGQAIDDKRIHYKSPDMQAKIDALCKFDLSKGHPQTYANGLRATCLALWITLHPEQRLVREVLQKDAAWCVMGSDMGAYTYGKHSKSPKTIDEALALFNKIRQNGLRPSDASKSGWDNSNSQYGLLGAWSAAEAEVEVPTAYWAMVYNHWAACQANNGQWPYSMGREGMGTLSMTAAGLASSLVVHEYLEPAILGDKVGREPFSPPVKRGLQWFETGNNAISGGGGYVMYGIERVGLASGFKHFGQHDWYRILADRIIKRQAAGGNWGDAIETSYNLLFLSRGRHPIIMNKLRYDGFWANRPRDLKNLSIYAHKVLERPLNWQVINVATDWTEWLDSPILQIASHMPMKFKPEEMDRLRAYVEAGGMIFTHADGDSNNFTNSARQLARDLFKSELVPVPADHAIFRGADTFQNIKPQPQLFMVHNGGRILMLHSPRDLSRFWQQRDVKTNQTLFDFGVNLFIYAAGKRDLRNRIDSPFVAAPKVAPVATTKVVRLEYAGPWDPEPGAWRRFANVFQQRTSYKLDVISTKMAELKPGMAPIAHLTGTVKQQFNDAEAAAIKAYVEAGGVLFVDLVGGVNAMDADVLELFRKAFPGAIPGTIAPTHPLLNEGQPGMQNVSNRRLRDAAIAKLGRTGGQTMIFQVGKGHVIYSPLDITSGLLGTGTAGIVGYDAPWCDAFVQNLVFWTMDGQKN